MKSYMKRQSHFNRRIGHTIIFVLANHLGHLDYLGHLLYRRYLVRLHNQKLHHLPMTVDCLHHLRIYLHGHLGGHLRVRLQSLGNHHFHR